MTAPNRGEGGPWPRRILAALLTGDAWSREFLEELDHQAITDGGASPSGVGVWWWMKRLASWRTLFFVLLVRRRRREAMGERGGRWPEWGLGLDLRHTVRSLAREPRTALFVVVTLALGVGSMSAMYGVADRLFLSGPRHVPAHDELFRMYVSVEDAAGLRTSPWIPYRTATAMQELVPSLDRSTLYRFQERLAGVGGRVVPVRTSEVDGRYFEVLGPAPAAGRFFGRAAEGGEGSPAVVSHALALAAFGSPEAAVGRTIDLTGDVHAVVAVAPEGFSGPHLQRVDVWIPFDPQGAGNRNWWVVGRAPGVWERAAEAGRIAAEAQAVHDETDPGRSFRWAVGGRIELAPVGFDDAGRPSAEVAVAALLFAVMGLVLLLACANAVNLLLARTTRRRPEVAVRLALGSGRWRVARLLVLESVILAALGGALSIPVTVLGGAMLRSVLLPQVAWAESAIDLRMLAATGVVALVAGLLVGVMPALASTRTRLAGDPGALRSGSRRRTATHLALAAGQIGLAAVLLVSAGLFVKSFLTIRVTDLGVEAEEVLTVALRSLDPEGLADGTPGERDAYARALQTLRAVDVGERSALAVGLPFGFAFGTGIWVPGRDSIPELPGGGPYVSAVSDRYFEAVGTPILRGVPIDAGHVQRGERVVVVSESAAALLWPGQEALGRCVRLGGESRPCAAVVGVASDVHQRGYREPRSMQFYVPLGTQQGFSGTRLVVRPGTSRTGAVEEVRSRLTEVHPSVDYVDVEPLAAWLEAEVRPWRLGAVVLSVTSVLAGLVAVLGVYGVLSFLVAQRRREIGVRIALGASVLSVRGLVLRLGLGAGVAGVVAGIGVVVAGDRWLAPLLFETSVADPVVLGLVSALLVACSVSACAVPALQASSVAPSDCLRAEG